MGYNMDPGRPSEILQAEHLAKFGVTPPVPKNDGGSIPAKQAPIKPSAASSQPNPPDAGFQGVTSDKVVVQEEKKIDPVEFDKTGRLPLEALPTTEVEAIACQNGISLPKGSKREDFVRALKAKGVTDVSVEK
jgi:hypothetical protein